MRRNRYAALAAVLLLSATPALAHPHVFVTAKTELVFDVAGRIAAVRNIWQFDEAFSAYAVQGLDTNNDGALTPDELAPLAQINVDSLAEYDFFTWLTAAGIDRPLLSPTEYWLDIYSSRLTLFFTLPVAEPFVPVEPTGMDVFDPEYFVAFTFAEDNPVTLVDAPSNCTATYTPPDDMDAALIAALAMIPADQAVPENLLPAATEFASSIRVSCL